MALGKIKIKIKTPTPTTAEKLHAQQQKNRKAAGLPDPSEYKKKLDAMKSEEVEKPEVPKQRNYVAKNAKIGGAGKHKDAKKAFKSIRGRKHKKPIEESFKIGGMGGGPQRRSYGPPIDHSDKDDSYEPFVPKTEKDKKIRSALSDLENKMKTKYPKLKEAKDSQEYDYEGDMAKSDLRSIIHNAQDLHDMIDDDTNLAEWCQSKITLAEDYISTVANYMRSEMNESNFITVIHKGTKMKQKINPNSYETFKSHGFRKEAVGDTQVPFDKPYKKDTGTTTDKSGAKHTTMSKVKNLAKQAMKKTMGGKLQIEAEEPATEPSMKNSKEMSRKAQIVKNTVKGKMDAFQKEPELSASVEKN